ncbi:YciI family protein [Actinomadura barringtoniae]|uniref:YciI family protein n=1 Tax=Actinomadura barringtoniae TaxID=1427535 RepID=A0A939PF82_9ACTN|nr:YciI family protein [Actinomadura barringtoniae]MBO2451575.1 YciI family protein [Actinomadura barringtoniae]
MKYLILVYGNPENWEHPMFLRNPEFLALPEEERAELTRQAEDLHKEITESGELLVGAALADPVTATTFRGSGGLPVATDGPYLEAKEQLAGYFVVDCESPERAAEIASRFPDARLAAVEVRPIMDMSGQEM